VQVGSAWLVVVKRSARKDIVAGHTWVTLITERYPNGVLRGQIKAGRRS
jgi:hypothetical protein